MATKLRMLGTLMLVMGAAGATFASPALASKFTAGKVGVPIKHFVLKQNVFGLTGNEMVCKKVGFAGTVEAKESEEQKIVPTYEECVAFGFANAVVSTEGCVYRFTANGNVHLESCSKGGITVRLNVPFIAKCHFLVKNQTNVGAATYTNSGEGIQLAIAASAIHAEVLESTGACPLSVGTHTNATTTIEVQVEAEGTKIQWDK